MIADIDDLYRHSPHLRTVPLTVVALGANLPSQYGSPAQTLEAVIPLLQGLSESPLLVSSIIETEPDDCPPGSPRFANAVVVLKPCSEFSAASFLLALQALELEFGRQRKGIRNESRVLDLDLISFADQLVDTEFLILPHPRARQRLFVMEPLAEIWSEFRFPMDALSAAEHVVLLHS